jgi:hypothetical protein
MLQDFMIKVKPKVMPWETGNLQLYNLETKSLILEI